MIVRSRPSLYRVALAIAAASLFSAPIANVAAEAPQAGGQVSDQRPDASARPGYLEPLHGDQAVGVLGRKVLGQDGEELGLITDVIVDRDGRPLAAVIDFGGFLGVGTRKVAVDWNLLQFDPGQPARKVTLSLDRRQIQGAPEYRTDAASANMVGPPLIGPSSAGNGNK